MSDETRGRGKVFFDSRCALCSSLARRFAPLLASRGFALAPAPSPIAEMLLVTPGGEAFGGADAVLRIARYLWWAAPLRLIARLPGGRAAMRGGYRWIAARRHCTGGACALPRQPHWPGWLPLVALPALAFAATARMAAWLDMWAIAAAIFFACKWLSWWEDAPRPAPLRRTLAYLLLWPGMDAATFLDARKAPAAPALAEWLSGIAKILLGAALVWGIAPRVAQPLAAGWIGMAGIIFLMHFGAFHLLALAWQSLGIQARPIMRMPIAATSLGDFWGRRWNRGFNTLAHRYLFAPLERRIGAAAATLCAFLASGIVHELVISLPARGGYGLPTLYFLVQGAGLLLERSTAGRRLGLRRGIRGRLYALTVAGVPAYWLFHPLFVARVIHPFLEVIQ